MCSRGKGKASTPQTTSESAETAWTSFPPYEMVRKPFHPLFHSFALYMYYMYTTLPKFGFLYVLDVSYTDQGCIYLIINTVKTVKL